MPDNFTPQEENSSLDRVKDYLTKYYLFKTFSTGNEFYRFTVANARRVYSSRGELQSQKG